MQDIAFRTWLMRRYEPGVVGSRVSNCRTVERVYGDLDQALQNGSIDAILNELTYSTTDARTGRPNPSKVSINGDLRTGLATLKAAVRLYCDFRQAEMVSPSEPIVPVPDREQQRLGLERDLQAALRLRIDQLEPGLVIVDGGTERAVNAGFIDITAKDPSGALVVIELKAGRAGPAAISQILSYMGDLAEEQPQVPVRGIVVAADFDQRAVSAARMVSTLRLRQYAVHFSFSDAPRFAGSYDGVIS